MARKRKKVTCAYCGKLTEWPERDHVPPACLFPRPRPSDLVRVNVCQACHRPTGKDDEYFKAAMCIRDELRGNSVAQALLPSVQRDYLRLSATAKEISRSIQMIERRTPSGVVYWHAGFKPNFPKLERVTKRIVRGLYYHHNEKQPLPSAYELTILWNDGFDLDKFPEHEAVIREVLDRANAEPAYAMGDGSVFRYKFFRDPEVGHSTIWLLGFYETFGWLCATSERDSNGHGK